MASATRAALSGTATANTPRAPGSRPPAPSPPPSSRLPRALPAVDQTMSGDVAEVDQPCRQRPAQRKQVVLVASAASHSASISVNRPASGPASTSSRRRRPPADDRGAEPLPPLRPRDERRDPQPDREPQRRRRMQRCRAAERQRRERPSCRAGTRRPPACRTRTRAAADGNSLRGCWSRTWRSRGAASGGEQRDVVHRFR